MLCYGPFDTLLESAGCKEHKDFTDLYSYDAMGREISHTSPQGGTESRTFDQIGRLESFTDAAGHTSKSTYDPLDRPLVRIEGLGEDDQCKQRWTYDTELAGELAATQNSCSQIIDVFTYDALARPASTTRQFDDLSLTSTLSYDSRGLVDQIVNPGYGEIAPTITQNHYNGRDQLESVWLSGEGLEPTELWRLADADVFGNPTSEGWFNETSAQAPPIRSAAGSPAA